MSRAAGGRRSAGQQLHPRALSGDGDVEGTRLVRRSGVGAQSVIEGAHEDATRLQREDARNWAWYTGVVRASSHDEEKANPFPN